MNLNDIAPISNNVIKKNMAMSLKIFNLLIV